MAYLTTLDSDTPIMAPQTLVLSTTARLLLLDRDQVYTFVNEAVESDGTTATTALVWLSFDGAAPNTADLTTNDEASQCILKPDAAKAIGPGLASVYLDASGEVMVSVIPTQRQGRAW